MLSAEGIGGTEGSFGFSVGRGWGAVGVFSSGGRGGGALIHCT